MTHQSVSLFAPRNLIEANAETILRVLSLVPDEQTLDSVVVFQPAFGGRDDSLTMTEFLNRYPEAKIYTSPFARGQCYQVKGVRYEVLDCTIDLATRDPMLVLQPDDGCRAIEISAIDFAKMGPEPITTH